MAIEHLDAVILKIADIDQSVFVNEDTNWAIEIGLLLFRNVLVLLENCRLWEKPKCDDSPQSAT